MLIDDENDTYLVFGLGISGLGTVLFLQYLKKKIVIWDDNSNNRQKAQEKLGIACHNFLKASHLKTGKKRYLIISPGVPHTYPSPHKVVVWANERNIPVIGDVEIFSLYMKENAHLWSDVKIVMITGTNGKSTTTSLIAHILCVAYPNSLVYVCGNIGISILETLRKACIRNKIRNKIKTFFVIEISSFQIDLSPNIYHDIGVCTNITPDHLDRHGTMENYIASKTRLLSEARKIAILGTDTLYAAMVFFTYRASFYVPLLQVSQDQTKQADISIARDSVLMDDYFTPSFQRYIGNFFYLPGTHNQQNIALAYAVCRFLEVDSLIVMYACDTFKGLPHRLENVCTINGVVFINDSKATNAYATSKALVLYKNIFWILGGQAKSDGISSLVEFFWRVKKAYLIGENYQGFSDMLSMHNVSYVKSVTLELAVHESYRDAKCYLDAHAEGGEAIVLLSPACASFDQFRSFEHRGEAFRGIARNVENT